MNKLKIKKRFPFKILRFIYHKIYLPVAFFLINLIYGKRAIQQNKIVIDNFAGRGYGDNPKYIVNSLLKSKTRLDIIWEVSNMNTSMPQGIRKVRYGRPQALKELLTARIWIDNIRSSFKPNKRKGQYYLQTWHAGLGLKTSERQIESSLLPAYISVAKRDASMTDLMLSDSDWTTNIYKNWFWYSGKIVKTGFPRSDILINKPSSIINKVYSYFHIQPQKKILLYAPTFRDNNNEDLEVYKYNFSSILTSLDKKFGKEYVVLIRLHPNIANIIKNNNLYKFNKNIINATDYPDMQELIVACDVLLTDYSSCMFDAMIAGKKVFLIAKDLDQFKSKDRHLLFDIKRDLPFSFSNNEKELLKNIQAFNLKKYKKLLRLFSDKVGLDEKGNASEKVANYILKNWIKD